MKKVKNNTQLIDELIKQINKGFSRWKCKELNVDCVKCKVEVLRSYLIWYKRMSEDLSEWELSEEEEKNNFETYKKKQLKDPVIRKEYNKTKLG